MAGGDGDDSIDAGDGNDQVAGRGGDDLIAVARARTAGRRDGRRQPVGR